MENAKKIPVANSIWHELTSTWPALPQAQFMARNIQKPIPFLGSRKQIICRRQHPLEHSIAADKPGIAMDDSARAHD